MSGASLARSRPEPAKWATPWPTASIPGTRGKRRLRSTQPKLQLRTVKAERLDAHAYPAVPLGRERERGRPVSGGRGPGSRGWPRCRENGVSRPAVVPSGSLIPECSPRYLGEGGAGTGNVGLRRVPGGWPGADRGDLGRAFPCQHDRPGGFRTASLRHPGVKIISPLSLPGEALAEEHPPEAVLLGTVSPGVPVPRVVGEVLGHALVGVHDAATGAPHRHPPKQPQ